jgi:hypothetical protein
MARLQPTPMLPRAFIDTLAASVISGVVEVFAPGGAEGGGDIADAQSDHGAFEQFVHAGGFGADAQADERLKFE